MLLVQLLDPQRDYGHRTHDEVVHAVEAGDLVIYEGVRQPVLRDSRGLAVKGSGRFPITDDEPREWGRKEFVARAVDEFDDAWGELRDAMRKLDIRAHKIFWEMLMGRPREARDIGGNDLLIQLLANAQSYPSTLVYGDTAIDARTVEEEE